MKNELNIKWKHHFYQDDPDTKDKYQFYHSQRPAYAILEAVKELKNNYYEAKVIAIESDEEFHVMGQAGGCTYQYKIGDTFTLRHHKKGVHGFVIPLKNFGMTQDLEAKNMEKDMN